MKILCSKEIITVAVLQIFFSSISSQSPKLNSNGRAYRPYPEQKNAGDSQRAKLGQGPEKLILTQLLRDGNIHAAKEKARVDSPPFSDTLSYSGFITVNKTTNSNLFFWFFPAKHDPRNAPIMLWLQGGPGFSVMFSLFAEHGPFYLESNGNLKHRKLSWTNSQSMIYVDNPVGTGFSFTDSKLGYATSQADVSRDLYEFLEQFSIMFPEYSKNEWYIAGNSYAGKYIPPLALKIHNENQGRTNKKINLNGISLGAPFSDPMSVLEGQAEYYYFMGIVDEDEKKDIDQKITTLKSLVHMKNYPQAFALQDTIFRGKLGPHPSILTNYSGFESFSTILNPAKHPEQPYVKFLNQENIQNAIHVGRTKYQSQSNIVATFLIGDIFIPTKSIIEKILDLNYKVLIYVGQFDLYIPHTTLYNQIKSMEWKGKKAFLRKTNRKRVWKVDGEVAGYVRKSNNLAFAIVRNSGHNAPFDQNKWCYDLIRRFTHGFQLDV